VFPRIAAATGVAVAEEASLALRANVLLFVPALALVVVFADWLILGFYSPEFASAGDLLRLQALADFVRVVSWSLGSILFPVNRRGLHLGYHVTQNVVWVIVSLLFARTYGITAVVAGYGISYLVAGGGAYVLLHQAAVFRFTPALVRCVVISGGALGALTFAHFEGLPMVGILPLTLAIWGALVLTSGERHLLATLPSALWRRGRSFV
jgi:O-antigen/teichoic acid export membrane protein